MIKNENFINIYGWMINELKLSGNELLLYALIYGFSQNGENKFNGSITYMMKWLGCSKPTIIDILKKLIEKDLILKEKSADGQQCFYWCKNLTSKETLPVTKNNQLKNLTSTGKEILPDQLKNLTSTGKEILPNIYIDNNKDNINKNILKENIKEKEKNSLILNSDSVSYSAFLPFINFENKDLEKEWKDLLFQWLDYKKQIKKPLRPVSFKSCFDNLYKLSDGDIVKAREVVGHSIAQGWAGLFELKQKNNKDFTSINANNLGWLKC